MLVKEYRIPLPMAVEEYRVAQLYMIQVGGGPGLAARAHARLSTPVRAMRASQRGVSPRASGAPFPAQRGVQRHAVGVCGIAWARQRGVHGA